MKIQMITQLNYDGTVETVHVYEGRGLRRAMVKDLGICGMQADGLSDDLPALKRIEWSGGIMTLHELDVGELEVVPVG